MNKFLRYYKYKKYNKAVLILFKFVDRIMTTSINQPKQTPIIKKDQSTQQSILKKNQQCCRICLSELQANEIPELCLCKGQNSMVHQKCILEWMRRAQKYQQFPYKYYYLCDICRTKIYLKTNIQWHCKNWENIHFFDKSTCCTIMAIIIMLFGIAFIVIGSCLWKISDVQALNAFGMVIGGLLIVIDITIYTFQVILEMQLIIHEITKKQQIKSKRNQIMPSINQEQIQANTKTVMISFQKNQISHLSLNDYNHESTQNVA